MEYFFFSPYLDARRIRIRIKVKGRKRIRIKVTSRIRIRFKERGLAVQHAIRWTLQYTPTVFFIMALYVTVIIAEFGICIVTSVADRRWWIRIQEAKPMHIHADPDPDPG